MLKVLFFDEIISKGDEGIKVIDPELAKVLEQVGEDVEREIVPNILLYLASVLTPVNNRTFGRPYSSVEELTQARKSNRQFEVLFDKLVEGISREYLSQGYNPKTVHKLAQNYVERYFESLCSEE